MAKKSQFNINNFLKLSAEEQAKAIERDTEKLIGRLPSLKRSLKMYNDTSDEMYNLSAEEVELQGVTYARAVRTGSITTPTGKQAYQNFVRNLRRYARTNIGEISKQVAMQRFDDWHQTIKDHASTDELEYANYLINQMTDEMKQGFTRSRYFIDNSNWNSKQTFVQETSDGDISIQTLELELFLQKNHPEVMTRNIYNEQVATDGQIDAIRRGIKKAKKRKKG